ncbi:hypothetical protein ET996_09815 [Propioniciclava tarda]|uniref:VOC domain-containing protein n=1 Tax=Propioniciclava tarda TaxID=433330 RepID=A0A4V2JT37_PROTD|nr:hypothetical protein ET996_09815 [Propioniciclava tarda]
MPGTVTDQLVQQRSTHPRRNVLLGLVLLVDYREHGRTFLNQRANAGRSELLGLQIILGKVRSFTSPGRGPSTGSDHCSDHALLVCQDPTLSERFFKEVLDFYPTERVQPELESEQCMATWLSAGQKIHDIAILGGPVQGKLHHFAFQLEDWSKVLRAADIISMDDISLDIGPTRHGITRGETIYFFDPAGNRNEVFAGGYRAYPDRPCVVWTPDQLAKGIFYHDRVLNEAFTTVWT